MSKIDVFVSPVSEHFCVFSHTFEGRVVYVGIGEIHDAFNVSSWCQLLQIEVLRRLGDPDHNDKKPVVTVEVHQQSLKLHEATRYQQLLIGELLPAFQSAFDTNIYERAPHILVVQHQRVYPTIYAAAKAIGLSMASAYALINSAAPWRGSKGFNLVRTNRPVTLAVGADTYRWVPVPDPSPRATHYPAPAPAVSLPQPTRAPAPPMPAPTNPEPSK